MTQPPPQYYPPPQPSNGLGIAGFIVSLVAIPTLGILSPIALLLSFFALFRKPRGFAFAGFVVSGLGTLFLAAWVGLFVVLGVSVFNISKPMIDTLRAVQRARTEIANYSTTHMGTLPPEADGNMLIAPFPDGWGHPLHYEPGGLGAYRIRSAGPDGIYLTTDDLAQ